MVKILFVLTGASYWTLKDGHRHPTGYWAEEFVAPYSIFTDAGHEVTVATPRGVVPVVDTMSLEPRMAGGEENSLREEAVIEKADELRHPISLNAVRLEDYDAVYYPPAALLATRDANGDTPFANYRATGFCNEEEAGVGFADKAKWLLEDELKKLPTQYSRGPAWEPYTVVDRNLFTGQNPASSGPLAKMLVRALS